MNKYTVIIPGNVRNEIDEIVAFYFVKRKEHALEILENFIMRISSLKEFQEIGRIVPELERNNIIEYREIIEAYWRVIYRIESSNVVIYSLIDSRRNVEDILLKRMKARLG